MRTLLTILFLLPILLFGQGAANTRFANPTYLRIGDSTWFATPYDLTQISGTATVTIADVVDLQDSLTDSWNKQDSATVLLSWARAASTYQPKGSYLTAETDPVWLSDSTDYMIKTDINARDTLTRTTLRAEYIAHDTLVKTGIRTEYVNHDTLVKTGIRSEYIAHDTLVKTGLRAEYIGHDTLVQQYARSRDVLRLIATDTANQVRAFKFDAAGDMLIGSGNNTYSKVAKGSNGQSWRTISGTPQWWADSVGAGGTGAPVDSLAFVKGSASVYLRDTTDNLGIGTKKPWAKVVSGNPSVGDGAFGIEAYSPNTDSRRWMMWANSDAMGDFNIGQSTAYNNTTWSKKLVIGATGNVGIGTTAPAVRLEINSAADEAVRIVRNSAGDWGYMTFYRTTTRSGYVGTTSTGAMILGSDNNNIILTGPYATTVGATNRDLVIDNTGLIGYISSSNKTKGSIRNIEKVNWLYKLRPVNFIYLTDTSKSKQYGLVAEEVDTIQPAIVSYDYKTVSGTNSTTTTTKEIATVNYSRLVVPLLKAVQDHQKEIDTLNRLLEVQTITPLITGITKSQLAATMYISLSAPLDITGNKQIANGYDAQEITLVGMHNTNSLTLRDGDNIQISTPTITLKKYQTLTLIFAAPLGCWVEKSRSLN